VPQGIAWKIPWISIDLPTREGQHITQDISVTFNTSEQQAAQVFKAFRGADILDIEATFVRRTIITVAQNAAGQMSLSEVISAKRSELQDAIQKNLSVEIEKMGFHLDKVNLGASHLPQSLETQMQQKMAAQQQA
jgi:regulator of protease activity HflC (stomatin/prohibitin superfamily)